MAPDGERDDASDGIFGRVLRSLLAPLSQRKSAESQASYRRCPKCGERDLRLSDRHRPEPSVYQSRIFVLKWLCLSCGYRETETVEEIE
jgi:C4-type Zn-finger protein